MQVLLLSGSEGVAKSLICVPILVSSSGAAIPNISLYTQLKPQHEARLNLIANGNDTNADALVASGGGHQVPGSTFMNPLACLPKNKAASKCCGSASKAPDTEVQFGGGIR
mmetsp:Transcript_56264/g.111823  ORF Transcript_56264/g.111823 Transcript_56264/m.111823 type:complete len:111 (-) Transcript_56264:377-709(-)